MPPKLEYTLEAVNQRLKDGQVKARLFLRGKMIWMKATLPPKPISDRPKPYQQAISTGLPANEGGFKKAENEAKLLSALIVEEKFDWSQYIDSDRLPENRTARSWVDEFKKHYFETHSLSEKTWRTDYQEVYRWLDQDSPLNLDAMLKLIFRTERDSRVRLETCNKLQKLADYIGLEADLRQYRGSYGSSKVKSREIPSDEDIVRYWRSIRSPGWKWVYGVMAAFGLRDHEAFFCEWRDDGLFVLKGKTGQRLVFDALYPEWIDEFDLRNIQRPKIQDADLIYEQGELGDRVARQFRRYKIPFTPYALRHAYGIRTVNFGFQPTTAAALMGHSPDIHLKRYHRHISLKQNQETARRIMARDDRPKPPIVP